MTDQEAIISLTQGEKIKAGLIWASQSVEGFAGMSPAERRGAEKVVAGLVGMISAEAILANRLGKDRSWRQVIRHLEDAQVMIRSGVTDEAPFHLTGALQQVTDIGRRAMEHLKKKGLL